MAGAVDLGAYKCAYLPKTLWRVTHSKSQSRQDLATGDLVASDSTRTISDELSLKQASEKHFDWSCQEPSCFLSVFSSKQHAHRWAKQRERAQNLAMDVVYIHEIDTTKLPAATYVFNVTSLTLKLDIAYPYSTHEFIFLHRIPNESLRRSQSLGEIEEQGTCGIATVQERT